MRTNGEFFQSSHRINETTLGKYKYYLKLHELVFIKRDEIISFYIKKYIKKLFSKWKYHITIQNAYSKTYPINNFWQPFCFLPIISKLKSHIKQFLRQNKCFPKLTAMVHYILPKNLIKYFERVIVNVTKSTKSNIFTFEIRIKF